MNVDITITDEFDFVPVKCLKGGEGFFEGHYYALIRGADNNGLSIVRNTVSGDIYELIVHNTDMIAPSGETVEVLVDMQTYSIMFQVIPGVCPMCGCSISKKWEDKLKE